MSFLALFNGDLAPIDWRALRKNGLDKRNIAVLGSFSQTAFLQTAVAATAPNCAVQGPLDLEGRLWIIGRVRLDDRERLCEKLCASLAAGDALLCLRAYALWGEQSPEHLKGDFCFAIWDESRQQIFCARDQLGVRPLFYAQAGNSWLISDALDDIRSHSNLGSDLDNQWVADFLIEGYSVDAHRSVYKEVKRVPRAHILVATSDHTTLRRYWTLEVEGPLFYREKASYIEQFHDLMASAMRDRLPSGRVGVSLSGGLDSSTLAAKAVGLTQDASRVVADTRCFDYLIPDEERHFSSLVADRLGVRQIVRPVDATFYDVHWDMRDVQTPEPTMSMTGAAPERLFGVEMAKEAPVWLYGEGPDNALTFEWRPYLRWLLTKRDWGRFAGAAAWCLGGKEARPSQALFRRCALMWRKPGEGVSDAMRQWLRDDFVTKLDCSRKARSADSPLHSWRPQAFASFADAIWPHFLEGFDPTLSGVPIEWRHPYLDLRVLTFLLSIPPIPWARRKLLIREAMKGWLPEEVLSRDKAPLTEDPLAKVLQKHPLPSVFLHEETLQFVDEAKVPARPRDASEAYDLIRVRVLDRWLTHRKL